MIDMGKIKTRPWDVVEHLETDEDMAAYLEAALEEGDPALVAAALGDIARAKGMAQIARETGLGRESLYKALSPEGNPERAWSKIARHPSAHVIWISAGATSACQNLIFPQPKKNSTYLLDNFYNSTRGEKSCRPELAAQNFSSKITVMLEIFSHGPQRARGIAPLGREFISENSYCLLKGRNP
jgi:probable addiction module antidote protein